VTDQAGVPIANAQVFVVGTSFGAVSNERGYYFINNVPVGTHTIRGQFIGYAPAEVRSVRVQGGYTQTVDIRMQSSAVVLTGITVSAQANPIVPRDQVATRTTVAGDLVDRLPVDDVRQILALTPGVVESGDADGVSIRGGRPGEANVYIDGAPVRGTNSGGSRVQLGTNAVEEASVTTGALGVEFSDAQSGIVSFTTRSGGSQLEGSLPNEARAANTVIAYEPVWAIGTGLTPTPADIAAVHQFIRGELGRLLGPTESRNLRILYGGSVNPVNASGLLSVADVDGALVGGASLKASDFYGILSIYSGRRTG